MTCTIITSLIPIDRLIQGCPGLGPSQFARRLDVTKNQLERMLTGKPVPDTIVAAAANALGLDWWEELIAEIANDHEVYGIVQRSDGWYIYNGFLRDTSRTYERCGSYAEAVRRLRFLLMWEWEYDIRRLP